MNYTLRQIADAYWKNWGVDQNDDDRQRIYDRARMLRDKGLICSTNPRSQGKTMTFTEADCAFAVVALAASLNGVSWGTIELLNLQLRKVKSATGQPMFERNLASIKSGQPIFARIEHIPSPFPQNPAFMGDASVQKAEPAEGATQVLIWPVTTLAKPVLDTLESD
ncbi:MAG: hypothetical protein AAF739_01585 [Pseudomonadota bacterium]